MTDVKNTATETDDGTEVNVTSQVPELDGSVDALVANLRAAKEQLAELLAGNGKSPKTATAEAPKPDRSAA